MKKLLLAAMLLSTYWVKAGDSLFIHLDKTDVTSGVLLAPEADSLYALYEKDGSQPVMLERLRWQTLNRLMAKMRFDGPLVPNNDLLKHKSRAQKNSKNYFFNE